MKTRSFFQIAALLLFVITTDLRAQMTGPVAVGFRANPDGGGFSAKFFPQKHLAIETQLNAGLSYYNGPGVAFVGLVEYHIILPDPSWRIFIGPGAHVGMWERNSESRSQAIFGVDAIFGAEYVFKSLPIGLSADIKPAINFAQDVAMYPNNFFGLSARYYLGHRMPPPPPIR
jgi:hypothetical protein